MTNPVIIERAELERMAQKAARMALHEFTNKKINPWISQHQAVKILGSGGRGKLDRAMKRGLVNFYKRNPETKYGRVMVCSEDLEKLLNNPKI